MVSSPAVLLLSITTVEFADWSSVLSLSQSAVVSDLDDHILEIATFLVVEESVIMMKVDLELDSVREDEDISLEYLHIKIINVLK